MRGSDASSGSLFSYVHLEGRVPAKHPLRVIKGIVDDVLVSLNVEFERLYEDTGRQSIAPERLLRAEREAAIHMVLHQSPGSSRRITLGADKGYDAASFIGELRQIEVTPHIARNGAMTKTGKRRRSGVDGRTTRHAGYAASQR